jgi:2-succinyl-5-enolpyruvyl-6-hydroxy-3-cyclohexene-1-carboxylate synthase
VHLNCPFRKPLEPLEVDGDVPVDFEAAAPLAVTGRDGPFVDTDAGHRTPPRSVVDDLAQALATARRPLLVAGPADPPTSDDADEASLPDALAALAEASGAPLLADPLSRTRFGEVAQSDALVCGGYDAYLGEQAAAQWPAPDIVLRTGASPTSKPLRKYLAAVDTRQVVIDPVGGWREAEFTATELLTAAPAPTATVLAEAIRSDTGENTCTDWLRRFEAVEHAHWELVDDAVGTETFEGATLSVVIDLLPDPATLFVSNSMPVRDLDRFARPRSAAITALANRGASGIDGITSTALGAGSATDDPLVLVIGDLAYYHDMNGLLAVGRCDVDATIVLVNNDGGGIFHKLPIEDFDPPFTAGFKTPHGLDFEPTGELYELGYEQVASVDELRRACEASIGSDGAQVIECTYDAAASHEVRDELQARLRERVFGA